MRNQCVKYVFSVFRKQTDQQGDFDLFFNVLFSLSVDNKFHQKSEKNLIFDILGGGTSQPIGNGARDRQSGDQRGARRGRRRKKPKKSRGGKGKKQLAKLGAFHVIRIFL